MSVERVKAVPRCVEWGAAWLPADPSRWRLVRVDLDELAWYCAGCAERDFGDDGG